MERFAVRERGPGECEVWVQLNRVPDGGERVFCLLLCLRAVQRDASQVSFVSLLIGRWDSTDFAPRLKLLRDLYAISL